ncbi:hypothetical protein BD410DRAFT_800763 [Rickenella mellea]|uniref:Uncharacterized protein n=1 Tax=Rickenella mellea TaxID=50990 RepID=A0A4Y7QES7_9AGAM|nr:hypothetical protein BD410DRAFT_800763 [Rickenella mellea]
MDLRVLLTESCSEGTPRTPSETYALFLVLLAYDIVITMDIEIAQIWKQKFTGATSWSSFFPLIHWATKCTGLGRTKDILETFVTTSTATLIFTFRTWAIFQRSKIILIIVGLFGAAKIAANIVGLVATESYSASGSFACGDTTGNIYYPFTKASGYLSLAFDSVVFWLTFYKTIRVVRQMRRLGMTKSITYWILRDGRIDAFSGILTNAISNIMINRVILGLRHVSNTHVSGGLSQKSLPDLGFAVNSLIGNLGAPLRQSSDELSDGLSDDQSHQNSDGKFSEPIGAGAWMGTTDKLLTCNCQIIL